MPRAHQLDVLAAARDGASVLLTAPTGGGKTTTASLMARLYDPTSGRFMSRDTFAGYAKKSQSQKLTETMTSTNFSVALPVLK